MNKFFLVLFLASLLGCSMEFLSQGDYFYLEREGVLLPVWVRGKVSSGDFIIYNHGGPGGSAIAEATVKAFSGIEQNAGVVYWDQRGAGLSFGTPHYIDNESIARDLELLITLLEERYDVDRIFLMGHSYGVIISHSFLNYSDRATDIDGVISVNGVSDLKSNWVYSIEWVQKRREIYYSEFNSNEEVKDHIQNIYELGGLYIDESIKISPDFNQLFFSPISLDILDSEDYVRSSLKEWWLSAYSYNSKETPFLVVGGRSDGIFPEKSVEHYFKKLKSLNKRVEMFEKSAHHPFFAETEKFNGTIINFINNIGG